jgi:two-component system sensor histidine kinase FlrB
MQGLMQASYVTQSQLTEAFDAFVAAASRLEHSHRQLHEEVAELRKQLAERNRALASSVAETERTRGALRQILDALPCGVAVLESRSREIILLNPEAHRLLDVVEPADWQTLPAWVQAAVESLSLQSLEHGCEQQVMVEKDGRRVWLEIQYGRMTSPANKKDSIDATCLVLIIGDVTAQKSVEHEREKLRNVVALAEMATVLAHEIRNPLGSLELLTGFLAGDAGLNEDSKKCVQYLRVGIRSLSATVNNVLCFHNPDAQQMEPLALGGALRVAVEFIRPLADQKGVILQLHETLQDAKIAGNASGLRQIILNLACNAIRHTQPGGEIAITATVEGVEGKGLGSTAVIEFADTGSGIRLEDLPHIFKVGFTTGQTPGLGLTVCKRIVEQYRGTISVRSQLGRGTTFRMELPIL